MEDPILITWLNDFGFCPASIYFHNLYGNTNRIAYQSDAQINGSAAHKSVEEKTYSTNKDILQNLDVFSEQYGLIGKIDIFDKRKGELIERKKRIKTVFDGYVFQLYGQYFALKEMGYDVRRITLYSYDDNKKYQIPLPENDDEMLSHFEKRVNDINEFSMDGFKQNNPDKCAKCIYEPACSSSLFSEGE